jgi:hypothetical protein
MWSTRHRFKRTTVRMSSTAVSSRFSSLNSRIVMVTMGITDPCRFLMHSSSKHNSKRRYIINSLRARRFRSSARHQLKKIVIHKIKFKNINLMLCCCASILSFRVSFDDRFFVCEVSAPAQQNFHIYGLGNSGGMWANDSQGAGWGAPAPAPAPPQPVITLFKVFCFKKRVEVPQSVDIKLYFLFSVYFFLL